MVKSEFLPNFVMGLLIVSTLGTGMMFVFFSFAENYDIDTNSETLANPEIFEEVNELTTDITDNVVETGIQDESSNSKIISVGWNSIKLMLRSPAIFNAYMQTLSGTLNLSVGGIDFIDLMITIITIIMVFTLVLLIFLGRV